MWYVYTVEYYSAVRKNEIMTFAAMWKDLVESVILREVSQTEKKYCMTSLLCGLLKEMIQMNLQNKERLKVLEDELMVAGGKG